MVPYWSASADVVGIPHRGIWGQPAHDNAPENTLAAAQAAVKAGFRVIEVDALLAGPDTTGRRDVMITRYSSTAATEGPPKGKMEDYDAAQLVTLHMRKRDQSKSDGANQTLSTYATFLAWAAQNQALLVIDPWASGGDIGELTAALLDKAKAINALSNIAIRTDRMSFAALEPSLKPYLKFPYSNYEGQFLWSPAANTDPRVPRSYALMIIKNWHNETNASKQVLAYQINLYSPSHWSTNPIEEPEKTYVNLIDFIKQRTALGKRAVVWSRDPMGDKGRLANTYTWRFVSNSESDTRGSPFRNMAYPLATHLAITTDRPQWYQAMSINPYLSSNE
jgi:hypothetical protein